MTPFDIVSISILIILWLHFSGKIVDRLMEAECKFEKFTAIIMLNAFIIGLVLGVRGLYILSLEMIKWG